ncbi:MAG: hypothetical protein MHM6MM_001722 [Cercozoa sp. M6MM]
MRTRVFPRAVRDVSIRASSTTTRVDLNAWRWRNPEFPQATQPSIAVKANISVKGAPSDAASGVLSPSYVSTYDATVVQKLKEADWHIAGLSNMDEFGMGSHSDNSAHGRVLHPLSTEEEQYSPGGSSGGSAVLVALGIVDAALGSDTGGSVRQPASYCGVVGYKPSYGRLSRHGLVSYASSLDSIGVLARDVPTVQRVARIIEGHDPEHDATSLPLQGAIEQATFGWQGVTIGIPAECQVQELPADVVAAWRDTAALLEQQGARVREVSLPALPASLAAYYVIAAAEASSNLARYDGLRYGPSVDASDEENVRSLFEHNRTLGFGDEVKRRILLGNFVLSTAGYQAFYGRAQKVRRLFAQQVRQCMQTECDFLLTPTCPDTAPSHEALRQQREDNRAGILAVDAFTTLANLAGVPAVSVPGVNLQRQGNSAPSSLGMQLMAPHMQDSCMLNAARSLQELLQ